MKMFDGSIDSVTFMSRYWLQTSHLNFNFHPLNKYSLQGLQFVKDGFISHEKAMRLSTTAFGRGQRPDRVSGEAAA